MENTSNIKLAIIDIDGLFYHSCKDTIEESIQVFKDKFQNILNKTQCTHYIGFYSNGRYFRHNIDPEYKGNRKKSIPPKYLKALKQWAIAEYKFQYMDKVEADDLCAYWMNNKFMYYITDMDTHIQKAICPESTYLTDLELYKTTPEFKDRTEWENVETILCTPDKDLLYSIEGNHFNYSYKLTDEAKQAKKDNEEYEIKDEDVIKGWWVETNKDKTKHFKIYQMIFGDSGDNIITPFPENCAIYNNNFTIEQVLNGYISGMHYCTPKQPDKTKFRNGLGLSKGIFKFQKNYRLLHMLENDEDFIREIGILPTFPNIMEIDTEDNINEKLTF